MGLAVETGMLADLMIHDEEGAKWLRDSLSKVNEVLRENNLPEHTEPAELPEIKKRQTIGSFPYSYIHYLRRVYARNIHDPEWNPLNAGDEDPSEDQFVDEESYMFTSHLLSHSDAEGFYLPIDFDEIIIDEKDQGRIPGGLLGSSYRLMDELASIAPKLGISLNEKELSDDEAKRIFDDVVEEKPLHIEKSVWLTLFEAAGISIEYKTAICFC